MIRALSRCLVLLLPLAACECGGAVQKISPALGLNDESLDFGSVAVGDLIVQTLRLEALSAAEVTLSLSLEQEGEVFAFQGAPPTLIEGRGFVDLRLLFRPTAQEVYAATLVVRSNDEAPGRGERRVLLSGEGKAARIEVTPASIRLSAAACAPGLGSALCHDEAEVVVENVGQVALLLEAVALDSAPAGLSLEPALEQTRLVPGERRTLRLRWSPPPDAPADQTGTLFVLSNALEAARTQVPLTLEARTNAPPQACVEVSGVSRRRYAVQEGTLTVIDEPVPEEEWFASASEALQVRPGYRVTLSAVCSLDPEGDPLAPIWSLRERPSHSRASLSVSSATQSATVEVDGAGLYGVQVSVEDSLGQTSQAGLEMDAVPRDDLFIELAWESPAEAPVDLDLHLIVDAGPRAEGGVYGEGRLFCEQDAFAFNPNPPWFSDSTLDDPRYLRDDQGTAGGLESLSLEEAPPGSRFRVAVHYWYGAGEAAPRLSGRLRGEPFEIALDAERLKTPDEVWIAAELAFPEAGTPVFTPLPQIVGLDGSGFDGVVGACL